MSMGRGGPPPPGGRRGPGFEHEKAKGIVSEKALWKWIFSYLAPKKKQMIVSVIFLFLFTLIETYVPTFQQTLIDDGIGKGDWDFTLKIIVVLAGLVPSFNDWQFIREFLHGKDGSRNIV